MLHTKELLLPRIALPNGRLYHAVRGEDPFKVALCGIPPGGRGWRHWAGDAVTCPDCSRKLEALARNGKLFNP